MKMLKKWNSAVSGFVLLCFGFSQVVYSNTFMGVNNQVLPTDVTLLSQIQKIEIPGELGTVGERYLAPSSISLTVNPASFLLHIQDAHSSVDAQRNIGKILKYVHEKYAVDLVLVEGAIGHLDATLLQYFREKDLNDKAVKMLTERGVLGGAELFLYDQMQAGDSSANAYGIENIEMYKKNLELFRKVYSEKESSEAFLDSLRMELSKKASIEFNKKLKDFFRNWIFYQTNQAELKRHLGMLKKAAKENLAVDFENAWAQKQYPQLARFFALQGLEQQKNENAREEEYANLIEWVRISFLDSEFVEKLEMLKDRKMPQGEIRRFLETLYIAGSEKGFTFEKFKQLSVEWGIAILQSELQTDELFVEVENLAENILSKLAVSENEKSLVGIYKDYLMLKKLFNLELSRKQYREVQEKRESLKPLRVAERLQRVGGQKAIAQKLKTSKADFVYREALGFYHVAVVREDSLFQRSIERLKETGKTNAALITGGFHKEGLHDYLREAGLSYVEITPRISEIPSDKNYLRLMTAGASPKRSQVASPRFATDLGVVDNTGINDPWKDEIVPVLDEVAIGGGIKLARSEVRMDRRQFLASVAAVALGGNASASQTEANLIGSLSRGTAAERTESVSRISAQLQDAKLSDLDRNGLIQELISGLKHYEKQILAYASTSGPQGETAAKEREGKLKAEHDFANSIQNVLVEVRNGKSDAVLTTALDASNVTSIFLGGIFSVLQKRKVANAVPRMAEVFVREYDALKKSVEPEGVKSARYYALAGMSQSLQDTGDVRVVSALLHAAEKDTFNGDVIKGSSLNGLDKLKDKIQDSALKSRVAAALNNRSEVRVQKKSLGRRVLLGLTVAGVFGCAGCGWGTNQDPKKPSVGDGTAKSQLVEEQQNSTPETLEDQFKKAQESGNSFTAMVRFIKSYSRSQGYEITDETAQNVAPYYLIPGQKANSADRRRPLSDFEAEFKDQTNPNSSNPNRWINTGGIRKVKNASEATPGEMPKEEPVVGGSVSGSKQATTDQPEVEQPAPAGVADINVLLPGFREVVSDGFVTYASRAGIHQPTGAPNDHVVYDKNGNIQNIGTYGAPSKDGTVMLVLAQAALGNKLFEGTELTPRVASEALYKQLESLRRFQVDLARKYNNRGQGNFSWQAYTADGRREVTKYDNREMVPSLDNGQTIIALWAIAGAKKIDPKIKAIAAEILKNQKFIVNPRTGLLWAEVDLNTGEGKGGGIDGLTEWGIPHLLAFLKGEITENAWRSLDYRMIEWDSPAGSIDVPAAGIRSFHEYWILQYLWPAIEKSKLGPLYSRNLFLLGQQNAIEHNSPGFPATEYAPNGKYSQSGPDVKGLPQIGAIDDATLATPYGTALMAITNPKIGLDWLNYLLQQPGMKGKGYIATSFSPKSGASTFATMDNTGTTTNVLAQIYDPDWLVYEGFLNYFAQIAGVSREQAETKLIRAFNIQAEEINRNLGRPIRFADKKFLAGPSSKRNVEVEQPEVNAEVIPDTVSLNGRIQSGHFHSKNVTVPTGFASWKVKPDQPWVLNEGRMVGEANVPARDFAFIGTSVDATPVVGVDENGRKKAYSSISFWVPRDFKGSFELEFKGKQGKIEIANRANPIWDKQGKETPVYSSDGKLRLVVVEFLPNDNAGEDGLDYIAISTNKPGRQLFDVSDIRFHVGSVAQAREKLKSELQQKPAGASKKKAAPTKKQATAPRPVLTDAQVASITVTPGGDNYFAKLAKSGGLTNPENQGDRLRTQFDRSGILYVQAGNGWVGEGRADAHLTVGKAKYAYLRVKAIGAPAQFNLELAGIFPDKKSFTVNPRLGWQTIQFQVQGDLSYFAISDLKGGNIALGGFQLSETQLPADLLGAIVPADPLNDFEALHAYSSGLEDADLLRWYEGRDRRKRPEIYSGDVVVASRSEARTYTVDYLNPNEVQTAAIVATARVARDILPWEIRNPELIDKLLSVLAPIIFIQSSQTVAEQARTSLGDFSKVLAVSGLSQGQNGLSVIDASLLPLEVALQFLLLSLGFTNIESNHPAVLIAGDISDLMKEIFRKGSALTISEQADVKKLFGFESEDTLADAVDKIQRQAGINGVTAQLGISQGGRLDALVNILKLIDDSENYGVKLSAQERAEALFVRTRALSDAIATLSAEELGSTEMPAIVAQRLRTILPEAVVEVTVNGIKLPLANVSLQIRAWRKIASAA